MMMESKIEGKEYTIVNSSQMGFDNYKGIKTPYSVQGTEKVISENS